MAQTIHLVGPGGLAQIRDALAIAAPGDVIHVQPGLYAHFTVSVGVTIRALVPGTVDVRYDPAFAAPGCPTNPYCVYTEGPTVLQPPSGQTAQLIGLRFQPTVVPVSGSVYPIRHIVAVRGGRVALDECQLDGDVGALNVTQAFVTLQNCTLTATGSTVEGYGLAAASAQVSATGCTFTGNATAGTFPGNLPGYGIRLNNTTLQGSNLVVQGGASLSGGPGAAALRSDGPNTIWISDSTLTSGGPTACPITLGAATGRIDRCVLAPALASCASLPRGLVVGIDRPQPLQNGVPFALTFRTAAGQIVGVFTAHELGSTNLPGLAEQPILLAPNTAFPSGLFVAGPNGVVTASWNIPAGPAFVDRSLWFQAASSVTLPVQLSPVAGGIVR
jgi:hypothetical protein